MFGFLASLALPAAVKRFIPHAIIVLSIVLVLGGLILWIDHRGYQRASHDRDAADARMLSAVVKEVRDVESRAIIRENLRSQEDRALLERIATNTAGGQSRIIKEMTHEVRFTDPALGIPGGVRDEINRAIAQLTCAPTDRGGIQCSVLDGGAAGDH